MKLAEPKPLTREMVCKFCEDLFGPKARKNERARTQYVSRAEFEEYVALGIVDREGRYL